MKHLLTAAIFLLAGCTAAPSHLHAPHNQGHAQVVYREMDPQWQARSTNATFEPSGNTSDAFATGATAQVDGGYQMGAANEGQAQQSEPQSAPTGGYIEVSEDRQDVQWGNGRIYVRALTNGTHYNLNQPAKAADALADDWSLVFSFDAPFQAGDTLWFCGPDSSVEVQVYDPEVDVLLFDGSIAEVPLC